MTAEKEKSLAGAPAEMQLVVFSLAGCELALEIHRVREIVRVGDITFMPKAPKFLEGVINLRGRIFPVLDLKKRFGMPSLDRTDETRILVVEDKGQWMGLLVDKVAEVLKVPPSALGAAEGPVLTIGPEFIEGLYAFEDRLVLLFRLEGILDGQGANDTAEGEGGTPDEERNIGD